MTTALIPLTDAQLKVGKKVVHYKSRAYAGVGPITDIQTKATGVWVTVRDDTRNVFVTVRPSQLYRVA